MTFRTPAEAAELANNTVYGLAASIWSENINVALDLASQVKAGVVWVNCTNQFDAACGFGGYRESGYGREGGREGMLEYLVPKWLHTLPAAPRQSSRQASRPPVRRRGASKSSRSADHRPHREAVHRRQAGAARLRLLLPRLRPHGELLGEAPLGNRKDIRNAVEAARNASGWARATAHNRAQVLYYIAENMIQRRDEIAPASPAPSARQQAAQSKSISPSSAFLLRRLGRQVRRRRPSSRGPQHHHRHARAHRRHRHPRARRRPASRPALARPPRHRCWQHRSRRPLRALPAHHRRPLSAPRHQRRPRRRRQPCSRPPRRPRQNPRRARRHRRHLVFPLRRRKPPWSAPPPQEI